MTKQELDKKMLALQQGDENAFEDIYNDTKRGLFAFILSICRNYHTAEDMMQTAYIRLRTTISRRRERVRLALHHCEKRHAQRDGAPKKRKIHRRF